MLSRFHLIPERNGQTDGRTGGRTDRRTDRFAISISRDKNCIKFGRLITASTQDTTAVAFPTKPV